MVNRSTYHHGDLANALMSAAMDRARSGPQALVMRDLARSVGVTPQAVYRHFPTFDHLLDAVKRRVLVMLGESVRVAAGLGGSAADAGTDTSALLLLRMRAAVEAYLAFAQNQPGLFNSAFRRTVDLAEAALVEPLSTLLDALVRSGGMDRSRRPGVEYAVWASAHGMAVLLIDGPLRHASPVEQEARRRQMVDVLLGGLVDTR